MSHQWLAEIKNCDNASSIFSQLLLFVLSQPGQNAVGKHDPLAEKALLSVWILLDSDIHGGIRLGNTCAQWIRGRLRNDHTISVRLDKSAEGIWGVSYSKKVPLMHTDDWFCIDVQQLVPPLVILMWILPSAYSDLYVTLTVMVRITFGLVICYEVIVWSRA